MGPYFSKHNSFLDLYNKRNYNDMTGRDTNKLFDAT